MVEVLRRLGERIHPDVRASGGHTRGEILATTPPAEGHPALRTVPEPMAPRGALPLMRGSLAPGGCVMKLAAGRRRVTGSRGGLRRAGGPARPYRRPRPGHRRRHSPGAAQARDGRGTRMPEVGHLTIPVKLHRRKGVRNMVRILDARMSGASTGSVVLHVSPESTVGGPLARLRTRARGGNRRRGRRTQSLRARRGVRRARAGGPAGAGRRPARRPLPARAA